MPYPHPGAPYRRDRARSQPAARMPGGSRLDLSARQQEVLELLANGVPARAIAARLGLAEATVRNHIRLILLKLGCHSQLEAVAVAFRLRLVGPIAEPDRSVRDGDGEDPPTTS